MPLPSTMTPIATTTLTTATATVTFSSIPQVYTDLVVVAHVKGGNAGGAEVYLMQFNGDTGTNYSRTELYGNGTSAASTRASNNTSGRAGRISGSGSSEYVINTLNIMNYSNTTTYKTWLVRENEAASWTAADVGLWRSTAAITSIALFSNSSYNTAVGSTITLYGIKAA